MAKDIDKLLEKYESEETEEREADLEGKKIKNKSTKPESEPKSKAKEVRLDGKDKRILYYLDDNARIPLSELAKKLRISKQNLLYRLKRLEKEEIILKYATIVDIHKLGLLSYRVYFRYGKINDSIEKEIIGYFSKGPEVVWCASLSGSWDLEVVFGLKNFIQLNNILKELKEEFGESISRTNVSMSVVNYHFPRDYLIEQKRGQFKSKYYGFEPIELKLDDTDISILKQLAENCRQNASEIGEKIGVTYHTVQQRIKQLEKKQIIQGHRILIDFSKVGKEYYKTLFSLGTLSKKDEQDLYSFLSSFNFVVYIIEVLGEWNLEVEYEVENSDEIDYLIRELRNRFPKLISDYMTLKVTKENKLNYLPI